MNQSKLPPILMIVGGLVLVVAAFLGDAKLPDLVTPKPNHEGAWVLLIEEAGERSPDMVRIQADVDYWKGLEGRGLKSRFYDVDNPGASSYKAKANEVGLPALVVATKDGELLAAKPAPATTDGVDQVVKEVTGR